MQLKFRAHDETGHVQIVATHFRCRTRVIADDSK